MIHPAPRDLTSAHEDRVARLRREIHPWREHRSSRRTMRRWVGRQLMRVGKRLATDPSYRPVRSN